MTAGGPIRRPWAVSSAPPDVDGVALDERGALWAAGVGGDPLEAAQLAPGPVRLVCPVPAHDVTGGQPAPLGLGVGGRACGVLG